VKADLNLHGGIKWSKVTENYLEKYIAFVSAYFDEVRAGRIKVRIMFTQTALRAVGLNAEQSRTTYFRLYYQFIKHSWGFQLLDPLPYDRLLKIFLDQLPDKKRDADLFKGYLAGLQEQAIFQSSGVTIRPRDVIEVCSHDYVVLQGLDVILGSMSFRLNDKHLARVEGESKRRKKTIAKEKLYKHILREICKWKPHFSIGISTADRDPNFPEIRDFARWSFPYRHWLFIPKNREVDINGFKPKRKG
jgi:hypothetical protein